MASLYDLITAITDAVTGAAMEAEQHVQKTFPEPPPEHWLVADRLEMKIPVTVDGDDYTLGRKRCRKGGTLHIKFKRVPTDETVRLDLDAYNLKKAGFKP